MYSGLKVPLFSLLHIKTLETFCWELFLDFIKPACCLYAHTSCFDRRHPCTPLVVPFRLNWGDSVLHPCALPNSNMSLQSQLTDSGAYWCHQFRSVTVPHLYLQTEHQCTMKPDQCIYDWISSEKGYLIWCWASSVWFVWITEEQLWHFSWK